MLEVTSSKGPDGGKPPPSQLRPTEKGTLRTLLKSSPPLSEAWNSLAPPRHHPASHSARQCCTAQSSFNPPCSPDLSPLDYNFCGTSSRHSSFSGQHLPIPLNCGHSLTRVYHAWNVDRQPLDVREKWARYMGPQAKGLCVAAKGGSFREAQAQQITSYRSKTQRKTKSLTRYLTLDGTLHRHRQHLPSQNAPS